MKSHTFAAQHRIAAVVLTVVLAVTAVFSQTLVASAADENVYCKQMGGGYCTLASATMMLRSKGKLEKMSGWTSITQQTLKSTAWINGAGLRHSFTYKGMSVSYGDFSKSDNKSTLIAMLKKHPEGVEIYERALPHAIFLTRYDKATDTFYCADPALTASERTLASSYLRHVSKSTKAATVQKDIVNGLDSYWYISRYNEEKATAYDSGDLPQNNTTVKTEPSAPSNTETQPAEETKPAEQTKPAEETKPVEETKPAKETEPAEQTQPVDKPEQTVPDSEAVKPDTGDTDGVQDDSVVKQNSSDQIAVGDDTDGGIVSDGSEPVEPDSDALQIKFDTVKSFGDVSFSDVRPGDWFYSSVQAAYEMGLMSGLSSSEFGVNGEVTIAQTVTVAARIYASNASYMGYQIPDFKPAEGEAWYTPYAEYAYEKGIIGTKYYSLMQTAPDQTADRGEYAEILSGALPEEALPAINSVPDGSISDVDINTNTGKAIYKLYRAGVLAGGTDGLYRPESSIKRSEVAAIVSRMADSDLRVAL
jgi:hypothetical protein